jgi:hypothetical protein
MAGKGRPAQFPPGHVSYAKISAWQRQVREGLICWFCTDEAVATLVEPSLETVHEDGAYVERMVNRPVCGPGRCLHGYGP